MEVAAQYILSAKHIETFKSVSYTHLDVYKRQLKSYYRVDILFEGGLVDGFVVPTDLVDYKASLESNLEKVLKVSGLNYKKVKELSLIHI